MIKLPKVLPQPVDDGIHKSAKWLAGEGAGSWFIITTTNDQLIYLIERLSPLGALECSGNFKANTVIDLNTEYQITYPSNCLKVSVLQKNNIITLTNEAL